MILYHGSYMAVIKPDLLYSRLRTDFGKGFYLTPFKEQAESWSRRFVHNRGTAFVSSYEFSESNETPQPIDAKILKFDTYSHDWLNFITACRLGQTVDLGWDLIIGGVANDKVFDTIQLFIDGLLGAEEAIGRLRYNKPNLQYCIKTQQLLDCRLIFIASEKIS